MRINILYRTISSSVIFLVVCWVGCASVASKYKQAEADDSVESYQRFLNEYPTSDYSRQARSQLERLEYQAADGVGSKEAYEAYIAKHPDGRFANEARSKLQAAVDAEDARAFEMAIKSADALVLKRFVQQRSDSNYTEEARSLVRRLAVLDELLRRDQRLIKLKTGISPGDAVAIMGAPNGTRRLMRNFSVIGSIMSWYYDKNSSRYYGIVSARFEQAGGLSQVNRSIGVGPSPTEVARLEAKKAKMAEARRASTTKILVRLYSDMADRARVFITGERLADSISFELVGSESPGSIREHGVPLSGPRVAEVSMRSIDLLPGDYRVEVNGGDYDVIVPHRTYSTSNGRPTFSIFIDEDGSVSTAAIPD